MSAKELPLFTQLLVSQFRDKIPETPSFQGTNLSGIEGKYPLALDQKEAEKYGLFVLGFKRPPEFASMQSFRVKQGSSSIVIEDLFNHPVNLKDIIFEYFREGYKVGVRFYKNGDRYSAGSPFTFLGQQENSTIVWSNKKSKRKIVGIKDPQTETVHIFAPGDELDLFPSPRSIKRNMLLTTPGQIFNNSTENPTINAKKIALGGGFVFQLIGFDPEKGKFIIKLDAILDDRNPRDLYLSRDKNTGEPVYNISMEVRLGIDPKKPNQFENLEIPNLESAINSQNLDEFMRVVAAQFVNENSTALYLLFSNLLALSPQTDSHSIKCFFTTRQETPDSPPRLIIMPFDIESQELSDQWREKAQLLPIVDFLPPNNFDTVLGILLQSHAIVAHPTPDRLMQAVHLIKNFGLRINTADKLYISMVENYTPKGTPVKEIPPFTFDAAIKHHEDIVEDLCALESLIPKELFDRINSELEIANPETSHSAQFGRLIKHLLTREQKEIVSKLKIIQMGLGTGIRLIYIEIGGLSLAYITKQNRVINIESLAKSLSQGLPLAKSCMKEQDNTPIQTSHLNLVPIYYEFIKKHQNLFLYHPRAVLSYTRLGD